MDQHDHQRIQQIIAATVDDLHSSIKHLMPPSSLRDFWIWVTENEDPKTWTQILGIRQLAILTTGILHGIVNDNEWNAILPYAVRLNTYFVYEIFSDNLTIGLADSSYDVYDSRRILINSFNRAMVDRLVNKQPTDYSNLLQGVESTHLISLFDQSLTRQHLQALYQKFINQFNEHIGLEYNVLPGLIANIETCARIAQTVKQEPYQSMITQGLIARYKGVSRLAEENNLSWPDLIATGGDTILVIPTLAYYASLLHYLNPAPVVDFEILTRMFHAAAIVVRLCNDAGTRLLEIPAEDRSAIIQQLGRDALKSGQTTLQQFILSGNHTKENLAIFTRIIKDIKYGEWNIPINGCRELMDIEAQIHQLDQNLIYITEIYQSYKDALEADAILLRKTPVGERIAEIIIRFVYFHRILYQHEFTTSDGEYAI